MKNINLSFCFKKKISKLYYQGTFVVFHSFFSLHALQQKLGDHGKNVFLFNINKFWDRQYPSFFCSYINTYIIFFLKSHLDSLTNFLSNSDLTGFYILIGNRFYKPSYFQNINNSESKSLLFFINSTLHITLTNVIFQLQKGLIFLLFLVTLKK